jgi:PKD repeat protein/photosystem II stability/assembly factor-like uncharacterized protein
MKKFVLIITLIVVSSALIFSQNINLKENSASHYWKLVGPVSIPIDINTGYKQGVGRVDCISFDLLNTNTVYIGSSGGGVWKSKDGGVKWIPVGDILSTTAVSSIVTNPVNSNIIYVSTGNKNFWNNYSTGIYKSNDKGITWNSTGLSFSLSDKKNINCLEICLENPNILFSGTNSGILKSIDGGNSWYSVLEGFEIKDIELIKGVPSLVYATSFDYYGGAHIFKSINSGESFVLAEPQNFHSHDVSRIELAVSPTNNDLIYALCTDISTNSMLKLYKSNNRGTEWIEVLNNQELDLLSFSYLGNNEKGMANSNIAIVVSMDDDNKLIVGGTHLWKSLDGGNTFELLKNCYQQDENNVYPYHHFLEQNSDGELYLGNDGGLYKSDDFGETWQNISSGLSITHSLNAEIAILNSGYIISSNCFTNPVLLKDNEEHSFNEQVVGQSVVDYSDNNTFYISTFEGQVYKSEDLGRNFVNISPFNSSQRIIPIAINKNNPNILYIGRENIYISENKGEDWIEICQNPPWIEKIEKIALSASSDNIFYITTSDEIWKTEDGGKSWVNISIQLSGASETLPCNYNRKFDIEIDYKNPNLIWVTVSDYLSNEKVFKSEDGGKNWLNISHNLPNLQIHCIVNQLGTNEALYIGTDIGVYYIDNNMTDWIKFSDSLPNVSVNDLVINYKSNTIIAATLGRGIWQSNLFMTENLNPISNFTVDNFEPCLKENVNLIDLTAYTPVYWKWEIIPAFFEFTENTNSFSQNPVVFFKQNGAYSITLTTSNEFGTDIKIKNNFIFTGKPFADYNYTSNNNEFYFQNLSFNANEYLWDFDDGTNSSEKSPVHTFEFSGVYSTKLTVLNNCGDDFVTKNIIVIISEIENISDVFSIYPNPSTEQIYLKAENYSQVSTFEIYNISGVLENFGKIENDLPISIKLEKGIYFCVLYTDKGKNTQKIIIE